MATQPSHRRSSLDGGLVLKRLSGLVRQLGCCGTAPRSGERLGTCGAPQCGLSGDFLSTVKRSGPEAINAAARNRRLL